MAARAAAPSSPNAASDSTASSMLVTRSVCCASSITGLPQICTLASPPNPNKLFFSLAFTSSEIKSRSPDAAMLARFTVTSTEPEPSSGKVRPAN